VRVPKAMLAPESFRRVTITPSEPYASAVISTLASMLLAFPSSWDGEEVDPRRTIGRKARHRNDEGHDLPVGNAAEGP
jgi:hypothetical protein